MASEAKPSNGYDIDKINDMLDRMEKIEQECGSIMGKAMKDCRDLRDDQKEIKEEAKSAGIRMKVFNELWKARKAIAKSEISLADLDGDDREQIEEILRHANDDKSFGDAPFGAYLLSVFS